MDFREIFIKEMRKSPILYDKEVDGYKCSAASRKAWQRVAFIVRLDVKTCKVKWRSLRRMYIKALNKIDEFPNKKIMWKYFKPLSFLEKHVDRKVLEGTNSLSEHSDTNSALQKVELSSLSDSEALLPYQNGLNGTDSTLTRSPKEPSVIEQKDDPQSMDFHEEFIEAVRKSPILYDKNVQGHNCSASYSKAWQQIACTVGLDAKICRNKWKNLRTSYVRSLCKRIQFPNKKSSWKYFETLSFLEEHIDRKVLAAANSSSELPIEHFEFEEVDRSYLSDSESLLPEKNGLNGTDECTHPNKSLATADSVLDINASLDSATDNSSKKSSVAEQKYCSAVHDNFHEEILKGVKRKDDFDATDLYFKYLSHIVKSQKLSVFDLLDLQSKLSKFLKDELVNSSGNQ